MVKYQLNQLFKDRHEVIYMVNDIPKYTIRKDKKLVYDNENYSLTRIPDIIVYKSRYDDSEVRYHLPIVSMTEEWIDKNLSKAVWEII